MNKEEYINFRNNNDINSIIYAFYIEYCILKGIRPLEVNIFFHFFTLWDSLIIGNLIDYLDSKFSVILVVKENKIIKII